MHCKAAQDEFLYFFQMSTDFSIALVSEPFTGAQKSVHPVLGLQVFQYPSRTSKVKACIFLKSDIGTALGWSQHSTPNLAAVQIGFQQRKLLLVSAYVEPEDDVLNTIGTIDVLLKSSPGQSHVIGMDGNGHHIEWGCEETNDRGDVLMDVASSNGLSVINTGSIPTFQAVSHGVLRTSIVDVTMSSDALVSRITDWRVNPDVCQASDHFAVSFKIDANVANGHQQPTSTFKYKNKTAKWDIFTEVLEGKMQESGLSETDIEEMSAPDIDAFVSDITGVIHLACDKSMKLRGSAQPYNPWWTSALEDEKKALIALHHRISDLKRKRHPTEAAAAAHQRARDSYRKSIRKESGKNFRTFCNKQGKEDVWSLTNRLLKDAPHQQPPATLKSASSFTTSAEDTASRLLHHFYPDDTPDVSENQESIRANQDLSSGPDEPPFTIEEVQECLDSMNPNKAPGPDHLTSDICQQFFLSFPALLTSIMNRCLDIGHFPTQWKSAHVRILPKPGREDLLDLSSFRPIGLLPVFGKLLEKLFIKRLIYSAQKSGSWTAEQYGFREQRSTTDALWTLIQKIKSAKSGKRQVIGVSLDIKAAFDNAWWPALMERLRKTGCPANVHRLITSYLQDRNVSLTFADIRVSKGMSKGCVQGSICGPTFWNLILDELLEVRMPSGCHIQAYADDVMLLVEGKSASEIQTTTCEALDIISDWGRQVKLSFSTAKTQAISFTPASKSISIFMDGHPVDIHPHIKLLGVILDSNLNFIEHSKYIIKKVSRTFKRLCMFVRPTWGVHSSNVETIYHHVIEPTITYAAGIWGEAVERTSVRRRLMSFHRTFAIRAIRAFHTVSAVAASGLSQFMPLHLKVREVHRIEKVRMSGSFDGLPDDIEMERRVRPQDLLHPAKRVSISPMSADSQEAADSHQRPTSIYTDGSKLESGDVGCAYVIYHPSGRQESRKFRLDQCCSVFQAELFAIHKALNWTSKSAKSDVTIYSDSLSSLKAIQDRSNTNPLVNSIHHSLFQMSGRLDVRFVWVKAHIGIIGNEEADIAAKDAATQKRAKQYTSFPISYAKHQIRKDVQDAWEEEYQTSDTGSITRAFFPTLADIKNFRTSAELSFEMTQVLTGHGFSRKYLHRFKISEADICPCGLDVQDFPHLVTSCPKYRLQQEDFLGLCAEKNVGPLDICTICRYPSLLESFNSFISLIVRTLKSFNICA